MSKVRKASLCAAQMFGARGMVSENSWHNKERIDKNSVR